MLDNLETTTKRMVGISAVLLSLGLVSVVYSRQQVNCCMLVIILNCLKICIDKYYNLQDFSVDAPERSPSL